ncbi:MAG: hypothetical protein L0332_00260 [Chloroflexi bacterium]|nr:hypothetical protein [Chloroflexota bacterium]MCI0574667.1 hypothetical protein [Chloroflexota bacterium]MCI0649051.1 hypothetical protein [Chloroflexota bacterium]MCI0725156.1 hypothetical protein [Chloroflexota bacterium]
MTHQGFATTTRGLRRDTPPMRLFEKAKHTDFFRMIVEGVLAETGYHAYLTTLERNNLMPGQCRGVALLKQDESRHIAYGVFLLFRLLAADDGLWAVVEETMNTLLGPAWQLSN